MYQHEDVPTISYTVSIATANGCKRITVDARSREHARNIVLGKGHTVVGVNYP